jgi:hypothetical protein
VNVANGPMVDIARVVMQSPNKTAPRTSESPGLDETIPSWAWVLLGVVISALAFLVILLAFLSIGGESGGMWKR